LWTPMSTLSTSMSRSSVTQFAPLFSSYWELTLGLQ
jgi:hypothetical protein